MTPPPSISAHRGGSRTPHFFCSKRTPKKISALRGCFYRKNISKIRRCAAASGFFSGVREKIWDLLSDLVLVHTNFSTTHPSVGYFTSAHSAVEGTDTFAVPSASLGLEGDGGCVIFPLWNYGQRRLRRRILLSERRLRRRSPKSRNS